MSTNINAAFNAVMTPAYIFSAQEFDRRVQMVKAVLGDAIGLCYSIKANPFLLAVLPRDFAHIEVCSPGELEICRSLQTDPAKIIFSGVNKSSEEIGRALDYGVRLLTAESPAHLADINSEADRRGITAEVLLRLSCESQFGMDRSVVFDLISRRDTYSATRITGLHYFTGTQKTRPKEIAREMRRLGRILDSLEADLGYIPERIEYGTGLAVDYFAGSDAEADEAESARLGEIAECLKEMSERVPVTVEMGRFFAAPCGYYVSSVADAKQNDGVNYAILDGGLHQLKYDGQIQGMQVPVITHLSSGDNSAYRSVLTNSAGDTADRADTDNDDALENERWTLCGSLCTTADVIARNVPLPGLSIGDRLVFHRTGAYSLYEGFSLFLSRDLPSIYILDRTGKLRLVRHRIETAKFNQPEDPAAWL